jgi:hypothetical protein
MRKKLSEAQRKVLERLAAGARIQQRIDGCFIYAGTTEVVRANTVYSLEDRRLINSGYITIAGKDALDTIPTDRAALAEDTAGKEGE